MELFDYLMAKKGHPIYEDLFSYLLGKNAGGSGTYTTFSGISLNISNTVFGNIKNFMLNSTELTQDGTPTPDNPVDVNVIKGDNNVKVENKNLFDYHWFGSDKEVQWEYYAGIGSDFRAIPIYIGVGNSATFSSNVPQTSPSLLYAIEDITVSPPSGRTVNSSNSRTIQANTNGYVYLAFVNTRQYYEDVTNGTYYIQIEIGSTATEYAEHQEQNYPISLSSKNLVDTSKSEIGKKIFASGAYTSPQDTNTTDYIYIGDFTNITIIHEGEETSWNTCFFDENKNVVSGGVNGYSSSAVTITVGNIKYIKFTYLNTNKPALYGDSDITTYEPYYNIEYCKIGDYADQIFKNTTNSPYYDNTLIENEWYLKKNIGKVVLDGSENWTQTSDTSVSNFYIRVANEIVAYGASGTGKSNYFKYTYANSAGNFYFSSATRLILSMENTYTLETFKTWLSSHNTNVYYPLATPTYIHLSESNYPTLKGQLDNLYNNAKSYNEQTNITQTNDDLPFNISVDVKVKTE